MHMQVKLMALVAVLYNFIHINDPDNTGFLNGAHEGAGGTGVCHDRGISFDVDDRDKAKDLFWDVITQAEQRRAREWKDRIAKEMWEDYTMYLAENSQSQT